MASDMLPPQLRTAWKAFRDSSVGCGVVLLSLGCITLRQRSFFLTFMALLGAMFCFAVRISDCILETGLIVFLPKFMRSALSQPLIVTLRDISTTLQILGDNIFRLLMVLRADLEMEEQLKLLSGMDPTFRRYIFKLPPALLLPTPLRRILISDQEEEALRKQAASSSSAAVQAFPSVPEHATVKDEAEMRLGLSAFMPDRDFLDEPQPEPLLRRKNTTDSLMDIVTTLEQRSKAVERRASDLDLMERLLAEKVAGKRLGRVLFAAHHWSSAAGEKACRTVESGFEKAEELGSKVKGAWAEPRTRATAASAFGGACVMGGVGGASGLASGGVFGAVCGIVPAAFTFGLSLPVGAVIGSSVGCLVGTVAGGAAGLLGGGVLGYNMGGRGDMEDDDEVNGSTKKNRELSDEEPETPTSE
mmetsp:Transcript_324/g.688  ORF Transcript_324/g.688 Transcript_324/m.688 type:complete len:417 (-) Transcript_324:72-1322(-)|eukprot:CAMPEP_0206486774 /NCGR_PEP_ID=MMETSP0324_2-20121206/41229_1 /ASSEMBLY_ACC=CAM_ASM_000836 /TAXON_ID=2866 /ORGANISM="Crypthecodinium cohnii, Strain Seligo" /LENGTH=416 /DNA_ID=CAMNT_0053965095 /DNA_START=236 /DNA_END=1486 /DNA_ORIENTATION=-